MPRKQRFKPSRKPKPNPSNEHGTIERLDSGSSAQNENTSARESVTQRDVETRSTGETSPG